jgi:hypothetical protein
MTPHEFRLKWTGHELKERSSYQEHFIDLCRMLDHPTPAEADPKGETFCFEYGAEKLDGANGFADVWKRECFGWEYKGLHANLDRAYGQLLQYRESLQNPPLLVVCDTDRIVVHTNFTNTVKRTYTIRLADTDQPASLKLLANVFTDPEALRPDVTPAGVTTQAAERVAQLADRLRARGVPPRDAAHFLMKLIFCLFAEDIGLLPAGLMTDILTKTSANPTQFDAAIRDLFRAMANGGWVFVHEIAYFNGGLFADEDTVPLQSDELRVLAEVSKLDWSGIDPAIFGTLFERSLDPRRRAQLGAHYTSRDDILDIIEPVLMAPLREEWEQVKARCNALAAIAHPSTLVGRASKPDTPSVAVVPAKPPSRGRSRAKAQQDLQREVEAFIERIASVRVLDPACGSGNFLYVALAALNDLEKEVMQATGPWRVTVPFRKVDPSQLYGIEIDPYAAELAQLTVWIGYLQWMHSNGYLGSDRPILKPLHNIEQRDAILTTDDHGNPAEPEWPATDVIVGNPPFLGNKLLRERLGDDYVDHLYALYADRVPNGADLCAYWFERARAAVGSGRAGRAGLLATSSLAQSAQGRHVLRCIASTGSIFAAWRQRDWVLDGAALTISIVAFDGGTTSTRVLDGRAVTQINPDLTSSSDVTQAVPLRANLTLAYQGDIKGGPFEVPAALVEGLRQAPNPLGRSNSDVLRPWHNGYDLTRRPRDMWIIDFGIDMPLEEAALYERPFEYVREHVRPCREASRNVAAATQWWLHTAPRPAMREAIAPLSRYAATTRHAKHRVFVWLSREVLPDSALVVFAREDDYFLGALQARPHVVWALATGSTLEDRPRYVPATCFDPFPFPRPSPDQRAAIAEAAKRLHEIRQSALDADPKLTMTELYNKRPTWLQNCHRTLDEAVFAAYGWSPDLTDEELLEKLLALNLERADEESRGIITPP